MGVVEGPTLDCDIIGIVVIISERQPSPYKSVL